MKQTKRILAVVLTLAMAFVVLGGYRAALAAAPVLTATSTTLTTTGTTNLTDFVDTATTQTVTWSATPISPSNWSDYITLNGTNITPKKNYSTGIVFTATRTDDGSNDTANLTVKISIPVTVEFNSTALTKVKDSTIDMNTVLTKTTGDTISWSCTGNGSITSAGVFTAGAAGTATVTATSTIDPSVKATKSITTIVPSITLGASNTVITAPGSSVTVTATLVDNGSPTVTAASAVNWTSSKPAVATVNSNQTSFTGGVASVSVSGVAEGSTTITATSAADNSILATIQIGVGSGVHLELEGPNLNKTNRTGEYTVYVRDAAGNISTAKDGVAVHWDWASSYLSLSDGGARSPIQNGKAHIHLYGRANSPSDGTRVYVWLEGGDKIYHTVSITGLSSLPQSGQDFTLVYVLGGLCAAMLAAAGVWYGVRKKNNAA